MSLDLYIVDAFAGRAFEGNPAAVVPLESWLADDVLQAIAAEHNLSETAFIAPDGALDCWRLRWFTPQAEVALCGHATLASGHVALSALAPQLDAVRFSTTRAGVLTVAREDGRYAMALPAAKLASWRPPDGFAEALGADLVETRIGRYPLALLRDEAALRAVSTEAGARAARLVTDYGAGHLTLTAPADDAGTDFVSRFFAPGVGIDEDPVTGSSFCDLAPYWAQRLAKASLEGFQASRRGGRVGVRYDGGETATLLGEAVLYARGTITGLDASPQSIR